MQPAGKKELRHFGLLLGGMIPGVFGLLLPWLSGRSYPAWPWIIAAALVLLAMVAPLTLKPAYRAWMRFGLILGWINTRIILGVVFYLVVTPIGVLMRIFRKDPMARRTDVAARSYRVRSVPPSKDNLGRPY